jgi:hypothetical protein
MEPAATPTPADNITFDMAVQQRTAELAKHYISAFDDLLKTMHPAMLVHPDTVLVVESKAEAAAYRVLLDAKGYGHIGLRMQEPKKPGRRRGNRSRKTGPRS